MGYTEYLTDPRHTRSSRRTLMAKTDDLPTVAAAAGWLALLSQYLPLVLELLGRLQTKHAAAGTFASCPETLPQHVKDKCKELVDAL